MITSELGIEPTQVRIKGQPRSDGSSMWHESMWEYEVKAGNVGRDWQSLEQGLQSLLSMFASRQPTLREYQHRFKVSIFCGHFTSSFDGGPTLSPSLLENLGDFGAELLLDTYCSDESPSGA